MRIPNLVKGLGDVFYESGYKVKPLLRKMFLSEEFYFKRAMHSQIKSPIDFVAMMTRQLEVGPLPDRVVLGVLSSARGGSFPAAQCCGLGLGESLGQYQHPHHTLSLCGIAHGSGRRPSRW